jgi:hypothetical protein
VERSGLALVLDQYARKFNHFLQRSTLVLQHHPTRKRVGYFGAVRLRDGKFIFARELNRFDAVSTWNFLRLLQRRSLNSRRRVIVITDNAK